MYLLDTRVRMDGQGRYRINDLHQAAGGEERHKPANWLRSQQAIELVEEIRKPLISLTAHIRALEQNQQLTEKPILEPIAVINGGSEPGTFVSKELVYAYAMWVSPAFHLAVIRAYDSLVRQKLGTLECVRKSAYSQGRKDVMEHQDNLYKDVLALKEELKLARHENQVLTNLILKLKSK